MLRTRTGTAGSAAGGAAAARYFLSETLKVENELLAKYYLGEGIPGQEISGLDHLAQAIAAGDTEFSAAAAELAAAHGRMFGWLEGVDGLQPRIDDMLSKAVVKAEMRAALVAEGGTVARVREDLDPQLAQRLGIDTTRPMTQASTKAPTAT